MPRLTGRLPSKFIFSGIEFDVIFIVAEQVILVIGIHTPFQITENYFQFMYITFNLFDNIGKRTWVGVFPSSFLADVPKSGLFSRTQIFVILIREILIIKMSTRGYIIGSWKWSLVSTLSYLTSSSTMASSTSSPTTASISSGNVRNITDRVIHTLTLLDVV